MYTSQLHQLKKQTNLCMPIYRSFSLWYHERIDPKILRIESKNNVWTLHFWLYKIFLYINSCPPPQELLLKISLLQHRITQFCNLTKLNSNQTLTGLSPDNRPKSLVGYVFLFPPQEFFKYFF